MSRTKSLLLASAFLSLSLVAVNACAAPINLGTAAPFGLLGGSGVTNAVPGTVVQGNVGSAPTPAITGFPPGVVVGTLYTTPNAVTAQAQSDLTAAYLAAAGAPCPPTHALTGIDLGTFTAANPLLPGVYCFSSSAFLTGTLALDAQGDPTAQWIFQIGSTLITATNANVLLLNGASPCNVFWQVGESATIQTNTDFVGNIMALTSITLNGGTLEGRALARNGAVTISGSQFVNSVCVPSPPCVSITKKANRTAAAVGDVITYTYTVCNCGPTTVTVNSVVDVPLGDLTTAFTTANAGSSALSVGACAVFTANHTVTGSDPDPIVNTVTVSAHDSTGPTSDTATASVVKSSTPPTTCMTVVKVADHIVASAGDLVTYTFTICNCGTAALTVDSVSDSLIPGLTDVFTTANGGATLAGGACASFTATRTVLASDPNPLDNVVTVSAHDSSGTITTASDHWAIATVPGPCLSVAKVPNSLTASIGDTVVYTFTVCNCGTPPVTVDTIVDSHFGDLLPDFVAANGGSSIIPTAGCVVFTKSRIVLSSDPNPLSNTVTVTAHAGTVTLTETGEASVDIGPRVVSQAYCGASCGPGNSHNAGFAGLQGDVISSVPGVLSIVPGGGLKTDQSGHQSFVIDWRNFVPAFGVVDYTVTNVTLRKTVPEYECTAEIGGRLVVQQGTANIQTWWPLMYELPGTVWTLAISYRTSVPWDDDGPGPHLAATNHQQVSTWQVDATLQSMKNLLELFRELPLGINQVPLISNSTLYQVLQGKLDNIIQLVAENKKAEAAEALIEFVMEVTDACIPTYDLGKPIDGGAGTGIANTCENPACCKLLADAEWVAAALQLGAP